MIGLAALAAAALAVLLIVEKRVAEAPLVDLSFFSQRDFVMGLAIGSLSMFSIMSLLLYFNLYAQSPEGLGLTALEAGAALLPLSVALLALALLGLRRRRRSRAAQRHNRGAWPSSRSPASIIGVAVSERRRPGLAGDRAVSRWARVWPCLMPRRRDLALSALSPAQRGQGSGLVNACTFLGGSFGVAGGAMAFAFGGFVAVLAMIALAGVAGAALGRLIRNTI